MMVLLLSCRITSNPATKVEEEVAVPSTIVVAQDRSQFDRTTCWAVHSLALTAAKRSRCGMDPLVRTHDRRPGHRVKREATGGVFRRPGLACRRSGNRALALPCAGNSGNAADIDRRVRRPRIHGLPRPP